MQKELNVLLVEDNNGDILLARDKIHKCNPQSIIEVAGSIKDAKEELVRNSDIQVILFDLTLPNGQGIDAFNQMYAYAGNIPIVILTGSKDPEVASSIASRCSDYLEKGLGIDADVLYRALRRAADRGIRTKTIEDLYDNQASMRIIISNLADTVRESGQEMKEVKHLLMEGDTEQPSLAYRVTKLEKDLQANWNFTRMLLTFFKWLVGAMLAIISATIAAILKK